MTRTEKIRSRISSDNEAFLITSDSNRLYASGFKSSAGFMLVCKEKSELYLDSRYFEMAKIAKLTGKLQPDTEVFLLEKKRREYLKEFCKKYNIKTLLYEDRNLTVFEYKQLEDETKEFCKIKGMGGVFEGCRISKDENEISKIKAAQKITDMAFSHILDFITPEITETEVALELECFMRRSGAESTAFETICVSGTKSSLPHGKPENIKLGKGFLTMDFGARVDGYICPQSGAFLWTNVSLHQMSLYTKYLSAPNVSSEVEYLTIDFQGVELDQFLINLSSPHISAIFVDETMCEGAFVHSWGHFVDETMCEGAFVHSRGHFCG